MIDRKLGAFTYVGKHINSRPMYEKVGDTNVKLWFANDAHVGPAWVIGHKSHLGKYHGAIAVLDDATRPEDIKATCGTSGALPLPISEAVGNLWTAYVYIYVYFMA